METISILETIIEEKVRGTGDGESSSEKTKLTCNKKQPPTSKIPIRQTKPLANDKNVNPDAINNHLNKNNDKDEPSFTFKQNSTGIQSDEKSKFVDKPLLPFSNLTLQSLDTSTSNNSEEPPNFSTSQTNSLNEAALKGGQNDEGHNIKLLDKTSGPLSNLPLQSLDTSQSNNSGEPPGFSTPHDHNLSKLKDFASQDQLSQTIPLKVAALNGGQNSEGHSSKPIDKTLESLSNLTLQSRGTYESNNRGEPPGFSTPHDHNLSKLKDFASQDQLSQTIPLKGAALNGRQNSEGHSSKPIEKTLESPSNLTLQFRDTYESNISNEQSDFLTPQVHNLNKLKDFASLTQLSQNNPLRVEQHDDGHNSKSLDKTLEPTSNLTLQSLDTSNNSKEQPVFFNSQVQLLSQSNLCIKLKDTALQDVALKEVQNDEGQDNKFLDKTLGSASNLTLQSLDISDSNNSGDFYISQDQLSQTSPLKDAALIIKGDDSNIFVYKEAARVEYLVETTLLEAPEEFRCEETTNQVKVAPEGSRSLFTNRDHDNAGGTEVGDTIQQTFDKDNTSPPLLRGSDDFNNLYDNSNKSHVVHSTSNSANATNSDMTADVLKSVQDEINNNSEVCENCVDESMKSLKENELCGELACGNASIETGVVEKCAQPPSGCSRDTTVQVCAAQVEPDQHNQPTTTSCTTIIKNNNPASEDINKQTTSFNLCWRFKNGRLVFDNIIVGSNNTTSEPHTDEDINESNNNKNESVVFVPPDPDEQVVGIGKRREVLTSRELNKRPGGESRLKQKLRQTDDTTTIENNSDITLLCEFDVRQVNTFPQSALNGFFEVYDELDDSDCETTTLNNMGTDGDKIKHNPDRDNLKSLLKRPGAGKTGKENKNRKNVIFNENKNEFFDADYIILIREECDYDDEDDDGACTCSQHEMVRLTCCEPNCNCSVYEGFEQAPQSPKFAPPLEFVDAVTLSPPEGYKDMELGEQQLLALQQMARRGQRQAVCRECSASHDDDEDGEGSQSDVECEEIIDEQEKEKTDQSQQTTPTSPPNSDNSNGHSYLLEGIADQQRYNKSVQRVVRDKQAMEERDKQERERNKTSSPSLVPSGSPISGILKGGRLWKQQSIEVNGAKTAPIEPQQPVVSASGHDSSVPSDSEEGSNRRSVRFIESDTGNKRDVCDGAPDTSLENERDGNNKRDNTLAVDSVTKESSSISPTESTEMMLTFKLGNHVLISNNSLKPNSAVRQLFPCTKPPPQGKEEESIHQYLVTAESLRAFEEAKRSKLPQIIQSGETDDSIKRTIERNTLRRSLIRYEPRVKKNVQKTDDSLAERIKQLTCDVDDVNQSIDQSEEIPARVSPTGEEARKSPETNHLVNKNQDKSFSPSSSSTASSNSSSVSSTYRKLTDLFAKREKQDALPNDIRLNSSLPDLGNGGHLHPEYDTSSHPQVIKLNSTNSNESRKQFLAPLSACVSGVGPTDEFYYHLSNHIGERASMASSVGTEYSLEDIDEGLKINCDNEDPKRIAPDVLVGTPSASESGDELAMFVQQDAGRIERIKKKYQPDQGKDDEDEHDDYGFNKRPSVRGIKPRFGTTTEILQQIQNQLQPPTAQTARVSWPYYSESGLTSVDNSKTAKNINQNLPNYHYQNVPDDGKTRGFSPQYRPTSLQDENLYQNCTNQRCVSQVYRTNVNHTYSSVMRVGGQCNEYYQSLPRLRNGRPISPPPQEISKNYHQTMVYIPYNHIEGYQPSSPNPSYYVTSNDYARVSNQNQINKRYAEPIYQQRIYAGHVEEHYAQNTVPTKPMVRVPFSGSPHMISSRSESPLPGQFSTARSTQTPSVTLSTCYYPNNPRYRPVIGPVWQQGEGNYVSKINRHSFPSAGPPLRYPTGDNISLTDSDSQHSSCQIPNGFRQSVEVTFNPQKDSMPNSPTKPRFIERGVPEGAASVSPQDSTTSQSASTMTSPTSPQNPPNQKPLFYAMNV